MRGVRVKVDKGLRVLRLKLQVMVSAAASGLQVPRTALHQEILASFGGVQSRKPVEERAKHAEGAASWV